MFKAIGLVLLSALLGVAPAGAVLGEHVSSVETDRRQLQGHLSTVQRQSYSFHEIQAANGVVVREYVSPAGWVFGVSWQGPVVPDLSQLLGAYYPLYQQAVRSATHRRGPLVVHSGQLVLQIGGHMRAHYGRAWLTGLLPGELSPEVVR